MGDTLRAVGLSTLQSRAYCEGMVVVVVVCEQFAAGGAEGTETCWSGQRQQNFVKVGFETSPWLGFVFTRFGWHAHRNFWEALRSHLFFEPVLEAPMA